ncbi:MAG: sulfatase-like hydrolase/transferase [Planctomycetota bacterium]
MHTIRFHFPSVFSIALIIISAHASFAERPNIILIFTDDQRADAVGYSGNTAVSTPNLDRLARQGLVFENCFVNTSICAISRANIISGQYPGRHGIDDFFKTFAPDQLQATMPARLQRAGYQTAFFGKWGIGDSPKSTHQGAAVFDYWAGQPHQTSFFYESDCRFVNFNGFERPLNDLCDCPADSRGVAGHRNRIGKANLVDPLHSDSTVIPMHAERFLDGRDQDKPFCMMLFFKGPHSPFPDWDPAVEDATRDLRMPIPPSATLAVANRQPEFIRDSLGGPTGMRYLKEPGFLQQHLRDYYRLVSSLDLGVGRIVKALEERGLDKNTVILFTSDNGHFKGEHGLAGKWLMHEPSLRVPGFIYDPRQAGGLTTRKLVITTDFTVTALALAGIEKPDEMTGLNLLPLITDPASAPWRDAFFYDHPYTHRGKIPKIVGVRTERHSYIRYISETPAYEQLFDLDTDPLQLSNLIKTADADLVESLRQRCNTMRSDVGTLRE